MSGGSNLFWQGYRNFGFNHDVVPLYRDRECLGKVRALHQRRTG